MGPSTHKGDLEKISWLLASDQYSSSICGHLESEPKDRYLSFSPFLSLQLYLSDKISHFIYTIQVI